jgi:hypothetical protein
MSDFVNRTSAELVRSGNDPDYPGAGWIINPDLSAFDAIGGYDARYATISGDDVLLKSQAERDAVDAADLEAGRDSTAAQLDELEGVLRAFALAVLDEINLHAVRITAILDAIDNASNLAGVKTAVAAIPDVPQRTVAQLKAAIRSKLGS